MRAPLNLTIQFVGNFTITNCDGSDEPQFTVDGDDQIILWTRKWCCIHDAIVDHCRGCRRQFERCVFDESLNTPVNECLENSK